MRAVMRWTMIMLAIMLAVVCPAYSAELTDEVLLESRSESVAAAVVPNRENETNAADIADMSIFAYVSGLESNPDTDHTQLLDETMTTEAADILEFEVAEVGCEDASEPETMEADYEDASEPESMEANYEDASEPETVEVNYEDALELETVEVNYEDALELETMEASYEDASEPETVETCYEGTSECEAVEIAESDSEDAPDSKPVSLTEEDEADVPNTDSTVTDDEAAMEVKDSAEDFTSIFDFRIDPYGLIEVTGAARYGGGTVEPGARLIFQNREGIYRYSSHSDSVKLKNDDAFPALVTVTAIIEDIETVQLMGLEETVAEEIVPAVYLALADNQGHEFPIKKGEPVTISTWLPACTDPDAAEYSFFVMGNCNPDGDWSNVDVNTTLTLTWSMETVLEESYPEDEEKQWAEAVGPVIMDTTGVECSEEIQDTAETSTESETETITEVDSLPETSENERKPDEDNLEDTAPGMKAISNDVEAEESPVKINVPETEKVSEETECVYPVTNDTSEGIENPSFVAEETLKEEDAGLTAEEAVDGIEDAGLTTGEAVDEIEDTGLTTREAADEIEDADLTAEEAADEIEDAGLTTEEATDEIEDAGLTTEEVRDVNMTTAETVDEAANMVDSDNLTIDEISEASEAVYLSGIDTFHEVENDDSITGKVFSDTGDSEMATGNVSISMATENSKLVDTDSIDCNSNSSNNGDISSSGEE